MNGTAELLPLPGDQEATRDGLNGRKARGLAATLGSLPFARLIACRTFSDKPNQEAVVFEVEVERGQVVVHDIRPREVIAVLFAVDDTDFPEVLALRADFPLTPHRNLCATELPRSLCIYEDSYGEYKLKWSPARFVQDIRNWLAWTARGELHGDDQPLEPLLLSAGNSLVIPDEFLVTAVSGQALFLNVHLVRNTSRLTFVADEVHDDPARANMLAIYLRGTPQPHGLIRHTPRTVEQLHDFLKAAGLDLVSALRQSLRAYLTATGKRPAETYLVIIVDLPKTRTAGGPVETTDRWAFQTQSTIAEVGEDVGVSQRFDGHAGLVLGDDLMKRGQGVELILLRRLAALSAALASALSGVEPNHNEMCFIGVGAIGSQVLDGFLRTGYGSWTVVDDDSFLPHNAIRHALPGPVGANKAEAMAEWARIIKSDSGIRKTLPINVLRPGERGAELVQAFDQCVAIVDCSASVAVSRKLARDTAGGRRVCVFLNPSATDVVVLAEPADRSVRLDQLEMAYYRELTRVPQLQSHLRRSDGAIRYSNSCRDLSSVLPQHLVTLNGAIARAAIRRALEDPQPFLAIWSTDPVTITTIRHLILAPTAVDREGGAWQILTDMDVLQQLSRFRAGKLPKETGGVLLGSFDVERKIIHVAEVVPSPPDSKEWPNLYIRGSQGLKAKLEQVVTITQGGLEYVGEWHSHPDGAGTGKSPDDRRALETLAGDMANDGRPALMVIIAENSHFGWYVSDCSGI